MLNQIKIRNNLFYFSLGFVFLAIPYPKFNLNTISIILLFISWIFYSDFNRKKELFKENYISIIIISLLWIFSGIGYFFSEDTQLALKVIQKKAYFFLFPLILLTLDLKKENVYNSFDILAKSTLISSLFALCKIIYLTSNDLGLYNTYSNFSKILNIHTTYFGFMVVVSILYHIYDLIKIKRNAKIYNYLAILFFLYIIYMLSSRMSLIAFALGTFTLIIFNIKTYKYKITLLVFLLFLIGLFLTSSNFIARFSNIDTSLKDSIFLERTLHWKAVIKTLKERSIFFGRGTGDYIGTLYQNYKGLGFDIGYKEEYNAHNQFLESMLYFGIVGLIANILLLKSLLTTFVKRRYFLFSLVLVVTLFMLSESILERQKGGMLCVLVLCLVEILLKKQKQ